MERVYARWALGPEIELRFVWGDYPKGGAEPDIDAEASMLEASMAAWRREKRADERIRQHWSPSPGLVTGPAPGAVHRAVGGTPPAGWPSMQPGPHGADRCPSRRRRA